MEERGKQEEKNKRIGWLTAVGVQLILLILFYFIVAWREPFPPIPEYGIELGFTTSAGAPNTSSPAQQAPLTEEVIEEIPVEAEPVSAEDATESPSEPIEAQEQPITPNDVDSPVKVEDVEVESEEVIEEVVEEVDARAMMPPSDTESEDSSDKPSDGEDEQEVDERAIYGSQGTNEGESEGANLALTGWIWDFKPRPDDTSDQSGKIVYEIVVDSDGELRSIKTKISTVSPIIERKYRREVEKLTFSKTADYKAADLSTGTITFIIKSR